MEGTYGQSLRLGAQTLAPIDTKKNLEAIWRGERFEAEDAVEDALHVYELAIRSVQRGSRRAF